MRGTMCRRGGASEALGQWDSRRVPRLCLYLVLYKGYREDVDDSFAIIADIVGSRELPDRSEAQRIFLGVLTRASRGLPLPQPPYATVGDEFQAVAATLGDALALTLRAHLLLPQGHNLRFGIGEGAVVELDDGGGASDPTGAPIQDGPAWWAAREAIDHAHALQDRGRPFARTWLRCSPPGPGSAGADDDAREALVNSLLLLCDHAVWRLQPRQRRIMAGLVLGQRQTEIARAEKVSQQAVSGLARGAGAALLESCRLLEALDGAGPKSGGAGSEAARKGGGR